MSDRPSTTEPAPTSYGEPIGAIDASADLLAEPANVQGTLSHMSSTLGTTVAIQLLGILSGVVVARLLGVEGRGELAAVILWPSVLAYLGDFGGPLAYSFQSSRHPGSINQLIGNVPYLVTGQWIALGLIGVPVIAFALSRYETRVIVTSIGFLLVYVPISFAARYLNAINQGTGAFAAFNRVRLAVPLTYVAAVIGLAVVGFESVPAVAAAAIVSNVIALAVALDGVRWRFGIARPMRGVNLEMLRQSLGYGLRGHIGNLTPVDSMQLDLLLVTAVLGAHEAGLYAVAVAAAMVVRTQGTAFGLVALPAVAASPARDTAFVAAARIFRICLMLAVLTATAVAVTAPFLLPLLYGGGFSDAVPILEILVGAMVLASLRQVLGDTLRGIGLPGRATVSEVVSWLVAVAALAALLGPFQAVGAALAAAISYATALVVSLVFVARLGMPVSSLLRVRRSDLRGVRSELGRLAALRPQLVGKARS